MAATMLSSLKAVSVPHLDLVVRDSFLDDSDATVATTVTANKTICATFSSRAVHHLAYPVEKSKDLKVLDQIPLEKLTSEFCAQSKALQESVAKSAKVKQVDGMNATADGMGFRSLFFLSFCWFSGRC
jgi:hypothetical protein